MTRVLGIDPGGTTGACLIEWDGRFPLTADTVTVLDHWQLSFEEVPWWARITLPRADHVAIEKFLITPQTAKNSREYEALYVIGGILFVAEIQAKDAAPHREPVHIKMRQASVVKNAWGSCRLQETGLHGEVTGGHARDALRHALFHCQSI